MQKIINCGLGTLDFTNYPIISMTLSDKPPTSEDVKIFATEYIKGIKSTSGKFIMILDGTNVTSVPVEQRELLALNMQFIEGEYKSRYMRNFVVVNKPFLFILFQLVKLLIRPVVKQKVFVTTENAFKFASKFMENLQD